MPISYVDKSEALSYDVSMRLALWVLSVAFALLTPVLLIATNARLAVNSHALYTYSLDRYDAMIRTGLPRWELLKGTGGIIAYFNNDEEYLDIVVAQDGLQIPLFNQREVFHMRDVKAMVKGLQQVQALAMGLAFCYGVYALLTIALGHSWARIYLSRALIAGGAGTAALVLLMGSFAALGGFQALFIQFHYLSFSNLLWVLDPARDRLIQMFPEGFFFDATLLTAGATLVQAILLVVGGLLLGRHTKRLPTPDSPGNTSRGAVRSGR